MATPRRGRSTVSAIRHSDTRPNNPTEELRDFVAADEAAPPTLRYPRDPSLDPQLVWRGKDEQDAADLDVPVVPIYTQEKIQPRAIIDNLTRARSGAGPDLGQLDLFADFGDDDLDLGEKIEFYQHEQPWSNRMILGDSLLVMASLAEKEGLKGKVQTIYLDPPYGIKFGSNWQVSTRKRDVKDGSTTDLTRQPEQVKAFRDTWELGIHSYLAYLRDRLVVARELLSETGSIFIQIGDENVHLIRGVLDEIFGSENFISQITFSKTTGFSGNYLSNISDYIVWYGKNARHTKYRQVFVAKQAGEFGATAYKPAANFPVPGGHGDEKNATRLATSDQLTSQGASLAPDQAVEFQNRTFLPPSGLHWKTTVEGMYKLINAGRVFLVGNTLRYLRMMDDFPVYPISSTWTDTGIAGYASDKMYVVQTLPKVVERCILMTTDPGDLVLDPTCGSGTTAYVAEQWGRRWITIDTSRVALALARTRLMAAKYPYYLLADSPEGAAKEAELTGLPAFSATPPPPNGDIKQGFVYKRVPHITLKSIANNPDIQPGMTREEIDAAIARHAEFETLFDQPYEDPKRVRVTGPFTVESLSPHRVLPAADTDYDGTISSAEAARQGDFATMILDNLRRAGVQNGFKGERLTFDRLEPHAGTWLNAAGEFTDANGESKRVAVALGPEHGTVSADQVNQAAKEAVRGHSFDVLVVAGFAFDPAVGEEARRWGKLTVLPTRMNPDLAMGDELLKKTGAGNLFMVFGEPDIDLSRTPAGEIVVTIHGVDVYDPTTGQVRSNETTDIACWFIDTDYDEESFFVRHAYFTGADEPYTRLRRALRAEIDEDAWASLYRTESLPFPPPAHGKIAVKVINHYGDEVMQVYSV